MTEKEANWNNSSTFLDDNSQVDDKYSESPFTTPDQNKFLKSVLARGFILINDIPKDTFF